MKFMTCGEVHNKWYDDNLELGQSWSANVTRVLQDVTWGAFLEGLGRILGEWDS